MKNREVDMSKEYFVFECTCGKLYKIRTKILQEKSSGQFVCQNCKRTISYCKENRSEPIYSFVFKEIESNIDEISF